jgi:hypothetical protein
MSGLSASTYSCGGDAGRFGGGVSRLKYFVIGALDSNVIDIDSSSVGGADDNDEESEEDIVWRVVVVSWVQEIAIPGALGAGNSRWVSLIVYGSYYK